MAFRIIQKKNDKTQKASVGDTLRGIATKAAELADLSDKGTLSDDNLATGLATIAEQVTAIAGASTGNTTEEEKETMKEKAKKAVTNFVEKMTEFVSKIHKTDKDMTDAQVAKIDEITAAIDGVLKEEDDPLAKLTEAVKGLKSVIKDEEKSDDEKKAEKEKKEKTDKDKDADKDKDKDEDGDNEDADDDEDADGEKEDDETDKEKADKSKKKVGKSADDVDWNGDLNSHKRAERT